MGGGGGGGEDLVDGHGCQTALNISVKAEENQD